MAPRTGTCSRTSATQRNRIWHSQALYHWRMHEDSTASSLTAKPYAVRAWRGVLEDHLGSESCSVREGLFLGSMKITRALPMTTRVSILYRACDGLHQRRALVRSKAPRDARFFEVLLSLVHPADEPGSSALMTVEDLQSDVTIVVSSGIDCVNHHFLEELAVQAVRHDCGVVGGTILGADSVVLTAGLACLSDGTYVNPFEGLPLHAPGYMGQARVVRSVPSIAPHAFAFRTLRLLELNGLATISEDSLDEMCASLVRSAHAAGLKVLHTPYAVATLRNPKKAYYPRQDEQPPRNLMVNPNLEGFSSATALLKVGIQ